MKNYIEVIKNIKLEKSKIILLIGFLIICVIILSIFFSGNKSKRSIAKEISEIDSYFITYKLKLSEYKIIKRQTNKRDKVDYIWITIKGKNKEFEYSANYKLKYVLYNNGWILENNELESSGIKVLKKFDTAGVEKELSEKYANLSLITTINNDDSTTVIYNAEKKDKVLTTYYEIKVDATYKPEKWEVSNIDYNEKQQELNILGEWTYEDDNRSLLLYAYF